MDYFVAFVIGSIAWALVLGVALTIRDEIRRRRRARTLDLATIIREHYHRRIEELN